MYSVSTMQGWKKQNEDTYIIEISNDKNNQLNIFGIFDGHNGREISEYVSKNFTNELFSILPFSLFFPKFKLLNP